MSFKNKIQNVFRMANRRVNSKTEPQNSKLNYLPNLEYSKAHDKMNPNNCAIIERTGDGVNVGACCFYLVGGTVCPRHGIVKA
jgi:hypothetical protein